MMRLFLFSSVLTLCLTACPAASPTPAPPALKGTWEGRESFPAQIGQPEVSSNVRYVLSEGGNTVTGKVYFCGTATFVCGSDFFDVTGSHSGNTVTLRYTAPLGDPNDPDTPSTEVVTQATLLGTSLAGPTSYPSGSATYIGTTTLSRK